MITPAFELFKLADQNSNYKVVKVGVKRDEDTRYVNKGDSHIGPVRAFAGRLVVGDLVTSKVLKFSQNGANFLFETENSTYTLEKVKWKSINLL